MNHQSLKGVFAAAVTPLRDDFSPDLDQIPAILGFLAQRGCHGSLVLGTTGEGTAFSPRERREIFAAAVRVREVYPDFLLLAGTGTPSLQETIDLNLTAFDQGFDGVVVLPPYYHRDVTDRGLSKWYGEVITRSIPADGKLFAYHIPSVSGVPITQTLIQVLHDQYPNQFQGLKDSSGDPGHAASLGQAFGTDLAVFNGNDKLFSLALAENAAGCITAPANVISPLLRELWDRFQEGQAVEAVQAEITAARKILDEYPPAAPTLKGILSRYYQFPAWPVRPPLSPTTDTLTDAVIETLETAGLLK